MASTAISKSLPTLLGSECPEAAVASASGSESKQQQQQQQQQAQPEKQQTRSYAAAWAAAVARFGEQTALTFDGVGPEVRFTYKEMDAMSNRLARNLTKVYGVQAGDLIVTVVNNRPEVLTLVLASLKLGAVFVPLATDLRLQDCQKIVSMYQPKLVVCDQPQYMPFRSDTGVDFTTIELKEYHAERSVLNQLAETGSNDPVFSPEGSDEPALIFSTSGSTGLPKGVVYARKVMAAVADLALSGLLDGQAGDKHLLWVHNRGVGGTLLALLNFIVGMELVMVDSYPNGPKQWAPLLEKHEVTSMLLFGAAMNQMLQELPAHKFPSVRSINYGGSCFPPTLVQKSMEQFCNAEFKQAYGMTEVFPIAMLSPAFHKRASESTAEDLVKISSAGTPAGDVFIEDMDRPGSGMPPPPEKKGVGQICAHSALQMSGYYKNPEKTKEAMPDGKFMRTGDVGKIGEDGLLYILGRVKDIIPTYRGFNIAPRDLEEILYTHPAVGEAQVVGMLHPCGAGDMVVAWANAKAGESITPEELRSHCESAGLPSWQMPEVFNVSLESLPTNGGKLNKKALQELSFVRQTLVNILKEARTATSTPADASEMSEEEQQAASEAFHKLSSAASMLNLESVTVVFGDLHAATVVLESFGARDGEELDLPRWLATLSQFQPQRRTAWLLQLGSLLAMHERDTLNA